MDLHSEQLNQLQNGFRDPVIKLERCDNIWKTLQLIRSLQDKHIEDIQDWIKREPITTEKTPTKEPPMTFIPDKTLPLNLIGEPNLSRPYIKYQPIFNNGNESLPQFKLAEKSRVNLYHCEICSQEYCDYKRFTDHQETVHRITVPKKLASKKHKMVQNKVNDDFKYKQNSIHDNSNRHTNKELVFDENTEVHTVAGNAFSESVNVRCELCGKFYKYIKKHMVEYHKIKYIGGLSKVTDKHSNADENQSAVESESSDHTFLKTVGENLNQVHLSIQNMRNIAKRKLNMLNMGSQKRLRSICSGEEEPKIGKPNEVFKCNSCGNKYANYKTLCKHRSRNQSCNENRQMPEAKKNVNKSVDLASRHKTKTDISTKFAQDKYIDNNNTDLKISQLGSSFIKERSRSDISANGDFVSSGNEEEKSLDIKCVCGRTFRTTSILANHKTGCKFLLNADTCKSSETKTGGDKDSGINITIKKRNNSYEIVSKDGSDEELSRNGHNIAESGICEESSDSSSDNSDSSEFDDQPGSLVPEKSKYSENHRIVKLKLAEEDTDVDIEEDESDEDPENAGDMSFNNGFRVPLLRVLCKTLLIQQGIIQKEETSHRCRACRIYLGSSERLSKHIEQHKKLLKRSCSCGLKFSTIKSFDNHIAAVHPKCIVCSYCKEKFRNIAALNEHLCAVTQGALFVETNIETHPCPNCYTTFDDITCLDSHMKSDHLDPNLPYQCYHCLEKFPNQIARSVHLNQKHNRACSVCNQKFQNIRSGHKHEAYHKGLGFPCHICKKTYRSKSHQVSHVKTVHSHFSNDKIECFICHKYIKTKSFKKHVLRHNNIVQCEICNKTVHDFRALEKHIMCYHGSENYPRKKCNICGASFATQEQLDAHIVIEKSVKNK